MKESVLKCWEFILMVILIIDGYYYLRIGQTCPHSEKTLELREDKK